MFLRETFKTIDGETADLSIAASRATLKIDNIIIYGDKGKEVAAVTATFDIDQLVRLKRETDRYRSIKGVDDTHDFDDLSKLNVSTWIETWEGTGIEVSLCNSEASMIIEKNQIEFSLETIDQMAAFAKHYTALLRASELLPNGPAEAPTSKLPDADFLTAMGIKEAV